MKKILTYFFVTLGIIFFILLLGLGYVWFADPFGVRPFIDMMRASDTHATLPVSGTAGDVGTEPAEQQQNVGSVTDKHPGLSPAQESALETIGLDPAKLPQSITPEMESCFIAILGAERVAQIKGGDTPTPTEVFTTRSCYE